MVRDILIYPADLLNTPCPKVIRNEDVKEVVVDLIQTAKENNWVGLSANQIGYLKRIIVLRVANCSYEAMINPEIIFQEGEQLEIESCQSLPKIFKKVKRFKKLKLRYRDHENIYYEKLFMNFQAIEIQQKIDLLNGKLFIDK